MEKFEPELKPEWLRSNGSSLSNCASTSSRSVVHGRGVSPRDKLTLADPERSLSTNSRRSFSSNCSRSNKKDSPRKSGAYGSFGSSGSRRDRERERDFELRERPHLARNGFHDPMDVLTPSIQEKEKLRRSRSLLSERAIDMWQKEAGSSLLNGVVSKRTGNDVSFEREFPSLCAEDKNSYAEVGRVGSPPVLSSSFQSIHKVPVVIPGAECWNSVLVDVSVTPGKNGAESSSIWQATPASHSALSLSSATGLNMAETVAQPLRSPTPPQLPIDNQKVEEQTLRQAKQLIPLTPMSKSSVNSLDKMKSKGARVGDSGAVTKSGQQMSSQPPGPVHRAPVRSDTTKPSQLGNFQVLNREKNGVHLSARDGPIFSNGVSPVGLAPSASSPPLKSPPNQKGKVDFKGTILSSPKCPFGEHKLHSQAKDKHEFFEQLRNKTSNSVGSTEPGSATFSPTMVDSLEEKSLSNNYHERNDVLSNSKPSSEVNQSDPWKGLEAPLPLDEETDPCPDPVDPEEEAFLLSLGWNQNEVVDALTKEEIEAFKMKYKERKEGPDLQ